MNVRNQVLADIESTIDQLIENGNQLKKISFNPFYQIEATALEKTQESLLAHLMHLQSYLEEKGEKPPQIDPSINTLIFRPRLRKHKRKKIIKI